MNRYLVCISDSTPPKFTAFKVKTANSPDEVTVPNNTMCFTFIDSEETNLSKFVEGIVSMQLGNKCCSAIPGMGSKPLYIIGKIMEINGVQLVVNEKLGQAYLLEGFKGSDIQIVDI